MILITGAGGKTGKALTRALSKVESVCALIHNERHVSVMKSLGAEKVIVGEMLDESAIRTAMRDVRAVYHIGPNMNPDETLMGRLIIDVSREHKLEDIAEATKIVLTEPDHKNATYELAGTSATSHVQVAEILSSVLGYQVHAEKEEISYWKLRAKQSGMSEYAISNLIRMFEYYDKWGFVGNPNVLGWILKRPPATFESFFVRTLLNSRGVLE